MEGEGNKVEGEGVVRRGAEVEREGCKVEREVCVEGGRVRSALGWLRGLAPGGEGSGGMRHCACRWVSHNQQIVSEDVVM